MRKKKILLVVPSFYNLGKIVENELINRGHDVTVIESRIHKEDFKLLKTFTSFFYYLLNPFYKKRYTEKVIKEINNQSFDIFFTVGYLSTSSYFIKQLKAQNPNIKTLLYLWDSFQTWNFSYLLQYFDYKYSFDKVDCIKHSSDSLVYLPLFYVENNIIYDIIYDITHIGTINPHYNNRFSILKEVILQSNSLNLKTYIRSYASGLENSFFKKRKVHVFIRDRMNYLFSSKFRRHIKLLKKYQDSGFLNNTILPPKEVIKIENESKYIVDINLKNAGVSFRIINALAHGKKVITTNRHILNERFYSPNNISIIDKDNPVIDFDFLQTSFKKNDISYLRIDNWISKIFSDIGIIE